METYKLVMPENLNHYGYLFGGYMLMWVDEIAWMAASMEYPDYRFVTIGMDRVEFRHGVRQGTILHFKTDRVKTGNTSVNYRVQVFRGDNPEQNDALFSTQVTMVRVNESGEKTPL